MSSKALPLSNHQKVPAYNPKYQPIRVYLSPCIDMGGIVAY